MTTIAPAVLSKDRSVQSLPPSETPQPRQHSTRNTISAVLCPPPDPCTDVCPICRDLKEPTAPRCVNCEHNLAKLQIAPVPVRALTLYSRTSPIRAALNDYKNPTCKRQQAHQHQIRLLLELLINNLINNGIEWDAVCVVPSTNIDRTHPLHLIATQTRHLNDLIRPLRRSTGQLGHNNPDPDGYTSIAGLDNLQVLILDDVYTTGARSQSAAHTLTTAGATIACIAVIGRRINPDASPELGEWSRRHRLTATTPTPSR